MKKATGIVRHIDPLGRIVIPKELRTTFDLKVEDAVEIFVSDDGQIILKKYEPSCIFCNSMDDIISYGGKSICKECLEKINASTEK